MTVHMEAKNRAGECHPKDPPHRERRDPSSLDPAPLVRVSNRCRQTGPSGASVQSRAAGRAETSSVFVEASLSRTVGMPSAPATTSESAAVVVVSLYQALEEVRPHG